MRELVHDKVVKEILQEIMIDPVLKHPVAESLLKAYLEDISAQAQLLGNDNLLDYYRERLLSGDIIKVFIKSCYFQDAVYNRSYEELKALYEAKSYGDLFTEIYEDEPHLNEIFLRLVEETEGIAVTSTKQLQEITGITEIYGYWDEEKGETVPYEEKKPTKKEAQRIAFEQVGETFTSAMSYRYLKALEDVLNAGGKYSDLLQIRPSYFNLPETWSNCWTSDQYTSIIWATTEAFLINERYYRPDLRSIAEELEGPYSMILDAHSKMQLWRL